MDLRKKSRTFLVDGEVVTDFEVVFRKFYRQLYLYAYNFVMDEMEAEDIVQETFSVIWERKDRLPEELDVRAYLYTSVKYACLKYFRRLKLTDVYRQKQVEALLVSFADEKEEEDEIVMAVKQAMEKLTGQQARIVRMHVAEGLTYQEIAAQLGLSDNTVRTHLKRAYKVLRDHLSCFLAGYPFIFNFS